MSLIDRYILSRFTVNFAILFSLMFLFAVSIDLMLSLDRFVDAARRVVGEEASNGAVAVAFVKLALNFQAPRLFQFYAYLHGMVAVGAAGFTLAQLYRHKELVAMLAAGIGMKRIAMPLIVGAFALSLLQLVNQELLLPRVAPLLLRDHRDIGTESIRSFEVRFTPDRHDSLFQSPRFEPSTGILESPTIIERDDVGRTTRRITATRGTWSQRATEDGSPPRPGWALEDGVVIDLDGATIEATGAPRRARTAIDFYETDLSPRVLTVRRHGEYAAMLSLSQIDEVLNTPGIVKQESVSRSLLRHRYTRFASALVNVLVMWLALPSFLLREPAALIGRSLQCALISIPALIGAAVFMAVDLPGIAPAVGVFVPVLVLLPIVLGQWMYVKT